ncbi:MAG: glycosyltransferase family 2 protein [Desulfobacterales bacterium]|nr:glycosyltransferase family 2 protein [Desulfobacterales bacterium]
MDLLINCTWVCLGLMAYHYLGYPALLAVLARLRPRPVRQRPVTPRVSLIIAAYNEEKVIAEKIDNSLALDYPALEIIVVSDGSSDTTAGIVRGYADAGVVGLHRPQRWGKSAAVNRGAEQATGDIFVFSDANAFYFPDVIRKLTRNLADPAVGCVSGSKTVRPLADNRCQESSVGRSEGLYWRYESFIKEKETLVSSVTGVVGEMLALRHELFQPIPDNIINDDAFLCWHILRQGFRVVYEPGARCWETASASGRDDMVRRQRITAGRYQLLFRVRWWPWNNPGALFLLISHKFLRLFLPFLMVIALAANLLLLFFPHVPALMLFLLAGQSAFYALALLGMLLDRQGRPSWRLPALAYYILIGNLASLSGLFLFLTGRQSVLWQKAAR